VRDPRSSATPAGALGDSGLLRGRRRWAALVDDWTLTILFVLVAVGYDRYASYVGA